MGAPAPIAPAVHRRVLLQLAVATALAGAMVAVAHRIRVAEDKPYDIAFVPSAGTVRWVSLGHPTLAANLNWLRAVQYVGDERAELRGWGKLRPILELVTDLDPRHGYAYQVGANMLSSAGLIEDADVILEKGTHNVPDRYILPFHRAVNAFLYEGDHELAGRWFELAAHAPGAPPHLRDYVLAQYVKASRADAAISFLERLEEEARDDDSRRSIRGQIQRATLERDALALEEAALGYRRRVGIAPVALEQLVFEGVISGIPADPFGGRYYLDKDGRVRSTVEPRRMERVEPAARGDAWRRLKALESSMEGSIR